MTHHDPLDDAPEHSEAMLVKKEFSRLAGRIRQLPPAARGRLQGRFAQDLINEALVVDTPAGPLSFVLLGRTAGGRALKALTSQPGTIRWIDSFRQDTVMWDIGANVGVYALYAAKAGRARVVAFEPAAINYFLLAANCEVNGLDQRMECLLVGVGKERSIGRLHVSQFDSGQSFSFLGKKDNPRPGRQSAIILTMDQLVEEFGVAVPNYIKIDTPGLTKAILSGGARTLRRPEVEQVHVELPEQSGAGQRMVALLEAAGLTIVERDTHGGATDVTFARR